MKPIHAATLALCLTASPALATDSEEERGLTLMERGARLFFEGIMQEMEPAIDEMKDLADEMRPALKEFADHMGPALNELLQKVDDWSVYDPPEMLPNGDIILRRKTPLEPDIGAAPDSPEIEL